ncbi:RsmB/NOP family class I SAM-dependent RNA methyltransferase [Micrococcus lylae]|uniref:RsmB/NOP family class I SAM-dependent RNA methyltransferase n=1 Tax=Micrococcus lylae TaxID=1273 RepID=UPI003EBF1AD1
MSDRRQGHGSGRDDRRGRQDRRDARGRTRNRGRSGAGKHYSAAAPSQRTRQADPARAVAYEVVRAVHQDDSYANLVLPQRIRARRLDRRDAGFATELTYGTLRGIGLYDAILAECVDRPLEDLDAPVLDALRLGAHQLLGMRVPAHAALDATVALVRERIGAGPSGFVNAVLRRISETPREQWLDRVAPEDGSEKSLGIRHSHPAWIVRGLRQALVSHGADAAELTDLLEADNAAPVVNLVALPGLGDIGPVLAAGADPSPLAPDAALHAGGDAARLPGVRDGVVRVQDVGSQLTARALAAVPLGGQAHDDGSVAAGAPGACSSASSPRAEHWLDLCAGPGGKAALLAALAAERGAHLLANEVAEHRADLVRGALTAVPQQAWTVRTGDGRRIGDAPEGATGFDRILVDAPCTGLGALRRRPESRWRRTPADLAVLTDLQAELLDAAVGVLAPGGVLAYVTCSPHPAETVVQADDLLRRHPKLEQLDAAQALQSVAVGDLGLPETKTAQLWPHRHGTDAMFLGLFRRPA